MNAAPRRKVVTARSEEEKTEEIVRDISQTQRVVEGRRSSGISLRHSASSQKRSSGISLRHSASSQNATRWLILTRRTRSPSADKLPNSTTYERLAVAQILLLATVEARV